MNKFFKISLIISLTLISCSKTEPKKHYLEGNVFGTSFHITYTSDTDEEYKKEIDSLFQTVNKSLSTYDPNSDISKINKGDTAIVIDKLFEEVYLKSERIYNETKGIFDPTIGILVNAWGFGPTEGIKNLDSLKIKNLLQFVGFSKVSLRNNKIHKDYPEIYIDFNAIAKGFGVDVIARFLEQKNISNYLVEIGGEIRAKGKNDKNELWKIGIEKPNFDGTRSLQKIVSLKNHAMATSGNYRKFKIDSITGQKYAHTIDTKTGFTAKRDLLSASVIADTDCADVDGYATAFMAMGFQKTKEFLKKHTELKVFLIYSDEKGTIKTYSTLD